ncbi:MAG: selenide, water dikinase SelD [Roseococcus sp.]|nr:selenide, water dikinase SelD [Roseococcus sp.]
MLAKEVLLVGGGAAHLAALRHLAMRPLPPEARLTFIVPEPEQPYSGMVPGVMAGRIPRDAAQVDLAALARAAGARLILGRAVGLDPGARRLRLAGARPPLRYDLLSLAIGAENALVPGATRHALQVKPLGAFLDAWEALTAAPPEDLLVVGGGAAGVEVALAARARLGEAPRIALLAQGGLLARLAAGARQAAMAALAAAGIELLVGEAVAVEPHRLRLADGRMLPFGVALWAGGPAAPAWLAETGLALAEGGWLATDATLRSASHPSVFVAGDAATNLAHPRPRNGVFAVRQGVPLAENLRRVLAGRAPRSFRPQRWHLALLLAGETAIAAKGPFGLAGRWALRLKDRIDRDWVASFARLAPSMAHPAAQPEPRCAGCGAKVPPGVLARVLARLPRPPAAAVTLGLEAPDDAALLAAPAPGCVLVQSVDHFRSPCDDPWVFGRIAAAHALGDIAAMGGSPRAALAIASLPPAAEPLLEADLLAMLAGAQSLLGPAGAPLVGGHSGEAAEASLGFAVTGDVVPRSALRRSGLRPGDVLILTRPLGTGAILAGWMRGFGRGRDWAAALGAMQRDPFPASRILLAHGASAAADVTGFGLLGHLLEMLRASGCGARLDAEAVPALEGALAALEAGFASTLSPANAAACSAALLGAESLARGRLGLLLDPQTSGGLLAGVPAGRAAACLAALSELGEGAVIIGHALAGPPRIALQPAGCEGRSARDAECYRQDPDGAGGAAQAAAG